VGRVLPGSSAEKAGVRPGDEVVLIDGTPSKSITGAQYMDDLKKGQKDGLKLRIRHQNEKNTLDVTLAPPGK
jgi:C-terminal processing protease CtpA/Prc